MRWRGPIAATGLVLSAVPLAASPPPADPWRTALEQLQRDDAALQDIGWKLARANAPFCRDTIPSIGLLLQDMAGYGQPAQLRRAAGIEGDIAVQAVAAGSPAKAAGLSANDEILSLGNHPAPREPADQGDWQRLAHWHDLLDADLAQDSEVTIGWRRPGRADETATIAGVPICRSRFELLDDGERAAADGMRIVFGRDFAGFGYSEEQMAAAVAHELAHNVLHHREWLDREGRKRKNVRLTEREADRLMPWLIANAGFDPDAATRFMARYGPRHANGLFRKRTHDGWDERVEFIAAEVPQVRARLAADGKADWSRYFRRELPEG